MKEYQCPCGGKVVFENKKTFVNPDVKNGVCLKCKEQYVLIGDENLTKKEGGKNVG